jgi:hypothetical protein
MKRKNRRRKPASPNDGESGPDSDSELDRDSGYNSQSDHESDVEFDANAKAMYYQQKMNEFEAEGVTLSNPCDDTKAMMEAELEKWEL